MAKKIYIAPSITEHGTVVKETRGFGGEFWEYLSPKAVGVGGVGNEPDNAAPAVDR